MNISVDFTKDVFRHLHTCLVSLGFEKRKPGILTIKMSDEVVGWIGLNKATRGQKDFLEINPVVGVRNQRIEKLVADLLGEKFDEVIPATLAGNIGYMMPSDKYRPYIFSKDASVETVAEELVNSLREYGLPFIRSHTEMTDLVDGLRTCRFAIRFMADYRIPSGLFLLGQMDDAGAFLKAKLAEIGNHQDPAALRYKVFAAKLGERVGNKTA